MGFASTSLNKAVIKSAVLCYLLKIAKKDGKISFLLKVAKGRLVYNFINLLHFGKICRCLLSTEDSKRKTGFTFCYTICTLANTFYRCLLSTEDSKRKTGLQFAIYLYFGNKFCRCLLYTEDSKWKTGLQFA